MTRILDLYKLALKKHPKTTNAVTTGALFGAGDVSAQFLFPYTEHKGTIESKENHKRKVAWKYDFSRTARAIVYGSLIFSFVGDRWYKFLNYKVKLPNKPSNHYTNLLCRVGVDQLGFAPISLPFYFMCMSAMEGKSFDDAKIKVKTQWWNTLVTNWCVWPLFQAVNFSLIPVQHRLLAVNTISIFWNTFLSFKNSYIPVEKERYPVYYPPVAE
ncbi:hypothetical protein KAFR_0B01700 [Kazachstania africana CBS 2517]|uniref:Protein SYM1 n=1 Tax=Kazachstania africana (strain ATCC 22294 / BCRC 22015 / CBS 2517 / CECT 1963 / NBRC 1671 / NRRL Y-8276) TaxID=1071382 RepID=H2AQ19_KAZAF|nr:hypothetical protein KAFR_0B01700 [Kazachstania africana CBS 2517]CCF56469.1 hypothetical protein KAFR_0B01700 [Kazachstania africana CBS 2517]